ncbi:MAG TPA: histidine kinase N-terminal 7TM domain-containing protein [Leptolyngbyaceae cyanobacterium]
MAFQLTPYAVVLGITALIAAGVAIAAWRRRHACGASLPFILLMVAVTGYAVDAAVESAAIPLALKIACSKLEYVASSSVITFFLLFAIQFTDKQQWLKPRNIALLWVMPVLNMTLAATNEWHHLVWTGFLPGAAGSNQVIYQHGPGFFGIMAWDYLYTSIAGMLLIRAALQTSLLHRQQARLLLLGAIVPLIGSSLYMLNLSPPGLNITPLSFMGSGLIYFVGLFHFRMFDLIPVARDVLIESMSDGVLVLDLKSRIVDINLAAQDILGISSSCIGKPGQFALPCWSEIAQLTQNFTADNPSLLLKPSPDCYVEVHSISLRNRNQGLTGHLIVMRDVTQRHEVELQLRHANYRLKRQLREIERLQVKLKEQATRDSLTGLFNRRYFDERLPKELKRAAREGYSVAVILFDLDFFKRINDTFSHHAGDEALRVFAKLLQRHCRGIDIVCRYGGEEFVLALPGTSLAQAYQRAEGIRLDCQSTSVKYEGEKIPLTVSGGVGIFPKTGKTYDELLKAVDKALYQAKLEGRNCIRQAGLINLPADRL